MATNGEWYWKRIGGSPSSSVWNFRGQRTVMHEGQPVACMVWSTRNLKTYAKTPDGAWYQMATRKADPA